MLVMAFEVDVAAKLRRSAKQATRKVVIEFDEQRGLQIKFHANKGKVENAIALCDCLCAVAPLQGQRYTAARSLFLKIQKDTAAIAFSIAPWQEATLHGGRAH